MKKRWMAVFGIVAIVATTISLDALANKYKKQQASTLTPQKIALAEKNRSMTDCMTFSASHVSRGRAADKAEFKRQYGAPMSSGGGEYVFGYDQYTNIILDCSRGKCSCRCMQKY